MIDVINDRFLVLNPSDKWVPSFSRFHVLEKQKLIKTNSKTDQVTWVDNTTESLISLKESHTESLISSKESLISLQESIMI